MFLVAIAWGANLFLIIAITLIAFGAGLTTTDFLKSKERDQKLKEASDSDSEADPDSSQI